MPSSWRCRWTWAVVLAALSTLAGSAQESVQETTIAEIHIVGCRRIPEARVMNEVRLRPGQTYKPHQVCEAVRRLDATGWFYSVAVEEKDSAAGKVLTFRVIERPVVHEVVYEGAKHVRQDELEKITGLRKGSPMSPALNHRAARAIEQYYHEKGRLFAAVELVEGARDEDTRVVFRITEGPIVRIRDIRFEGNRFVSAARLKTQIHSRETILGLSGRYNPLLLEQDVNRLLEYYRTFGFFDARIGYRLDWNPGYESVDVVFVIDEGVRYLVTGYEIAGNKKLPEEVLQAANKQKPGEPFNENVVQASARRMQDAYGKQGYLNTRVLPEYRFGEEPGTVKIVYQVTEGPPARVGEILIVGNTVTRQNVILRQLQVYPGQILSVPDIRASERNLARLGIFKQDPPPSITIIDPESESEFKNLLVQVEEDRTGALMFGVGVNSDAGASASIVLHERNFDITRIPTSLDDILSNRAFRGAGQEFRLELIPGTEVSRYTISFREPYLFDTPYSFGASGYHYNRFFNDWHEQRTGGRFTIGRRFTPEWSGNISLRLEDVKISNFPFFVPREFLPLMGHSTVVAPRVALVRDTRDSILRPTEGNMLEIAYEQGLGDFTFPVFTVEDSQYWTVYERPDGSGRHVLMVRGQMGIAGSNTPLFERFFAGGFRTLRGFDFRGVGPDRRGFKTGGDFLLLGTVEYQVPILANDFLYLTVFSDFGTVEDDVAIRDFRASVGAGLRIIVPMFGPVPIALDWAVPVAKKDTDERRVFSFWVGFFR
mgnify:CR=1 FL=1